MNRIVALGDSITFGQHVDRAHCWTTLLQDELGVEVVNRGVCGETTRQALERVSHEIERFQPDVLLIQYGHNDCNRWVTDRGQPRVSLGAFRANLVELIDKARAFGVGSRLLIVPHRTLKGDRYEGDRARYATAVRGLEPRVETVNDVLPHSMLADALHLNQTGHETYARLVAESLAS